MLTEATSRKLGKYEIIEEIGKGGFATVYRARDPDLDRIIALKVLDPVLTRDPVWVARFRREARAVAKLDHPHVVTIYEVGEAEGMLYIATRLVEGGSLARRIADEGALPWDEVVRLVGQIASALDYAHEQGVIHRDLKAANVLLDGERGALLTDFGFARVVAESSFSMSISGGIVGTPHYIAPEVWHGQPATAQTDIYALGCILYELIMGEHLFRGDTTPAVMLAHFQPPDLPESWPEGIPSGLSQVLERALAKEPEARYAHAGELVEALSALEGDSLAEPYAALEAALRKAQANAHAVAGWEQAVALAKQIRAREPGYRDVTALKEKALEGLAAAQKAQNAAGWRDGAKQALAQGNLQGAEVAARKWQALAPDKAEADAFLERLAAKMARLQVAKPAEPSAAPEPRPPKQPEKLALFTQLRTQEGAGDWAGALNTVRRIYALEPQNPLIVERMQRIEAQLREAQMQSARPRTVHPAPAKAKPRRRVSTWIWLVVGFVAVAALATIGILAAGLLTESDDRPEITLVVTSPPLPTSTPTAIPLPDMDVYLVDEWGLALSYPSQWELVDDGYQVTIATSQDLDPAVDQGAWFLAEGGPVEEMGFTTAEEFWNTFFADFKDTNYVGEPAPFVVGGIQGLRGTVEEYVEGWRAWVVVVVADDFGYYFVALANPQDQWGDYEPVFDAILRSIELFPPSIPLSMMLTYTDYEAGFSVDYPIDWFVEEFSSGIAIVSSDNLDIYQEEGAQLWVTAGPMQDIGFTTAEEGWDRAVAGFNEGTYVGEPEYVVVGGLTGVRGTFEDPAQGFYGWVTAVVAGNYGYYIGAVTNPPKLWYDYEFLFEDMLSSVELSPP